MPLEVANYIHQLDPANPAAPDFMADTDNHLRLIKQTLKNTFPDITGPVRGSQFVIGAGIPIGGIIMWSGAINAIPAGWVLCAGQTGISRSDGGGTINAPNLTDRFIVGAGSGYAQGATGGSVANYGSTDTQGSHAHTGYTDTNGGHAHGGAVSATALTIDQIPSHNHSISTFYVGVSNVSGGYAAYSNQGAGSTSHITANAGGGGSHTHGISYDGSHTHNVTTYAAGAHAHNVTIGDGRPPYYAIAFIMKV